MAFSSHSTYFNERGEEVPSVTTILKILNKPFLTKWANVMGFKRTRVEDILAQTSRKGTILHSILFAYLMGGISIWQEYPGERDVMRRCLNSFIEWKKTLTNIEPEFMEEQFSCDTYGGTIDFYGKVNDKYTILDFKTSKKAYSSMFLQLAAYTRMIELKGYKVEQVIILTVNETKATPTVFTREQIEPYIQIFLKLADIFMLWYTQNIEDGWGDILA